MSIDARHRLERLFILATGAKSPRGAVKWWAAAVGQHPDNVSRILARDGDAPDLLLMLELLERLPVDRWPMAFRRSDQSD